MSRLSSVSIWKNRFISAIITQKSAHYYLCLEESEEVDYGHLLWITHVAGFADLATTPIDGTVRTNFADLTASLVHIAVRAYLTDLATTLVDGTAGADLASTTTTDVDVAVRTEFTTLTAADIYGTVRTEFTKLAATSIECCGTAAATATTAARTLYHLVLKEEEIEGGCNHGAVVRTAQFADGGL